MKQSKAGFELLMIDIIVIIIILVVDIGIFIMRVAVVEEYEKYNYSVIEEYEEMSSAEFAEIAIFAYQAKNSDFLINEQNNFEELKSNFYSFLKDTLGVEDVSMSGSQVSCERGADTVVFTVKRTGIEYKIRRNNN